MLLDSDMDYLYSKDSNSISYLKRTDINAELPQPAHIDMIIVITEGEKCYYAKKGSTNNTRQSQEKHENENCAFVFSRTARKNEPDVHQ